MDEEGDMAATWCSKNGSQSHEETLSTSYYGMQRLYRSLYFRYDTEIPQVWRP